MVRQSPTANRFNGRCNLYIDEKIFNNLKSRRLLLNERNEIVFKYRHKINFELSWLGATETLSLENSRDIVAEWFLLVI